jgi:hypothetical protein
MFQHTSYIVCIPLQLKLVSFKYESVISNTDSTFSRGKTCQQCLLLHSMCSEAERLSYSHAPMISSWENPLHFLVGLSSCHAFMFVAFQMGRGLELPESTRQNHHLIYTSCIFFYYSASNVTKSINS